MSSLGKGRSCLTAVVDRRRFRPLAALLLVAALILPVAPGGRVTRAEARFVREPPPITARAALVVDVTAGVELYALNPDDRLPPASTTKLATALVVVRAVPDLQEYVTVEPGDVSRVRADESQLGLVPGDILTVEQLLYGLLLPSGNDVAATLARYVGSRLLADAGQREGDPVGRFVEEMNALAATLGLRNTHFTNPSGLHDPDQYSSARDLALLAAEALKHKTIARIVRQETAVIESLGAEPRTFALTNTNRLLEEEGIHGVKTGTLPQIGACLIVAKWVHGRNRVIAVVLGSDVAYDEQGYLDPTSDRRWDDTRALLSGIERDFRWLSPLDASDMPGLQEQLQVWQVALKDESAIVVPAEQIGAFRYLLQLGPEGEPNEEVGRVLFFVGSEPIAERPVFQVPIA